MDYQKYGGWKTNRAIKAPSGDSLYAFPLHQIYLEDGFFHQTRSGPNWLGGLLTLSTCKHWLRTAKETPRDWIDVWLAGFTPKVGCGENYLMFLAQIRTVFESNYELGTYLNKYHYDTWLAKQASDDPRGDIYSPKRMLTTKTKYNHKNFRVPHGHVRMEIDKKWDVPKWQKDINYVGISGRKPVSMIFDRVHLYSRPTYISTRPLHRSGYKATVGEFKKGVKRV